MTREQRADVAWWLATAKSVDRFLDSYCAEFLCWRIEDVVGSPEDSERRMAQLREFRQWSDTVTVWSFDSNAERVIACCLIAAMIESGDL